MSTSNETTELAACPFCGWTSEKDHADDCYFSVSDQLRAAAPADLSLVPEVLAAWNRRALPPPAEPVQGMSDAVDAARYRWLESNGFSMSFTAPGPNGHPTISTSFGYQGLQENFVAWVRTQIDAARSQQSTGGVNG